MLKENHSSYFEFIRFSQVLNITFYYQTIYSDLGFDCYLMCWEGRGGTQGDNFLNPLVSMKMIFPKFSWLLFQFPCSSLEVQTCLMRVPEQGQGFNIRKVHVASHLNLILQYELYYYQIDSGLHLPLISSYLSVGLIFRWERKVLFNQPPQNLSLNIGYWLWGGEEVNENVWNSLGLQAKSGISTESMWGISKQTNKQKKKHSRPGARKPEF